MINSISRWKRIESQWRTCLCARAASGTGAPSPLEHHLGPAFAPQVSFGAPHSWGIFNGLAVGRGPQHVALSSDWAWSYSRQCRPWVINPDEISFKRGKNKDSNAIAFSDSRIGRWENICPTTAKIEKAIRQFFHFLLQFASLDHFFIFVFHRRQLLAK